MKGLGDMKADVKKRQHLKRVEDAKDSLLKDLEDQLAAAKAAQADKLVGSKSHLQNQLDLVSDKYLTVNGYMQALEMLKAAAPDGKLTEVLPNFADVALLLASELSELAASLRRKLVEADVMTLDDSIVMDVLDSEFAKRRDVTVTQVARELLVVNLLQNIGPSLVEIIQFRESTEEEIRKLKAEIAAVGDVGQLHAEEEEVE